MAFFSRTADAAFKGAVLASVVACGHLAFDELPLEEPLGAGDASVDGGAGETGDRDASGGSVVDRVAKPSDDAGSNALDASLDAPDAAHCDTCDGTHVSKTGNDDGPGTVDKPLLTIGKGIARATAPGGSRNVYVAGGSYQEKVTLVDGVRLLGGYQCNTTACTWSRDIVANETKIVAVDAEGVLAPSTVTRATYLDGFKVLGKTASAVAPTTVALTVAGGSPIVSNSILSGGDALAVGATAVRRSIGVLVQGGTTGPGPLIERDVISGGAAGEESIGVLLEAKAGPPVAMINDDAITSGAAPATIAVLATASTRETVLHKSSLQSGKSTGGIQGSWAVSVRGAMTIDKNRLNEKATGSCLSNGDGVSCGGIRSLSSSALITNNVVRGVNGARTAGIFLVEDEGADGSPVINGNTIDGAGGSGLDGSVSAAIALRPGLSNAVSMGAIRNNVLLGGTNKTRAGILEEQAVNKTARPAAVEFNVFWNPAPARNDFGYRSWTGVEVKDVIASELGTVAGWKSNLNVDPQLDATFHLKPTSPCIDKGTKTEAPVKDIDGQDRSNAVDIGADEVR